MGSYFHTEVNPHRSHNSFEGTGLSMGYRRDVLLIFLLITRFLITILLPKFACYSGTEPLHSLREQFWGRAALAPVILSGSGRFRLFLHRSCPLNAQERLGSL